MAENFNIAPIQKLDLPAVNAFVRELNQRLRRLSEVLEQRKSSLTLTGQMDAGGFRLTNLGTASADDDALPLGQLESAIAEINQRNTKGLTSEATEEGMKPSGTGGATGSGDETSDGRRIGDDEITQFLMDAAATVAPPNVAAVSALGTTSDPPIFALSDHTHGGVLGSPPAGGVAGQVAFFSSSFEIDGDNALFWDNTNKRLGIGTTTPGVPLDVVGNVRTTTQFESTVATGTAPLIVASTTLVANLNADMTDGFHASQTAGTANVLATTTAAGVLDFTARAIYSESAVVAGTRRQLNFIEGANISITLADNGGTESVDATIAVTGVVVGTAYQTIQEEGVALTQRSILNFVGGGFTAADDAGNTRTNVTLDDDLNALAALATTGFAARTGAGTWALRTITEGVGINLTNGDGVAGDPTIDLDINALTTETTPVAGDLFPFLDVSAGTDPDDQRKVTLANLATAIQTQNSLVDGSGGTNQVAFWSDANTITGDSDFIYVAANHALTISESGSLFWQVSTNGSDALSVYSTAAGAGDPYIIFAVDPATDWSVGVDNSDSDIFKIASGTSVASNTNLSITTGGTVSVLRGNLSVNRSESGGLVASIASNQSNTASSDAGLFAQVAGTSGGDAYAQFVITAGQAWTIGLDNDASDAFVIAASGALGTSNAISIATTNITGLVTLDRPLQLWDSHPDNSTTAAFTYAPTITYDTGLPQPTAFNFDPTYEINSGMTLFQPSAITLTSNYNVNAEPTLGSNLFAIRIVPAVALLASSVLPNVFGIINNPTISCSAFTATAAHVGYQDTPTISTGASASANLTIGVMTGFQSGGAFSEGAASTFSCTLRRGFRAVDITFTNSPDLVTNIGFDVDAMIRGSTAVIGYRSAIAASGSVRYFLQSIGNAPSSIGGPVYIGSTTPTVASARLHVDETTAITDGTIGSEVLRAETQATNDNPNYRLFNGRVTTTDATVTTLLAFTIPATTTVLLEARVVARRTGGASGTAEDAAAYIIKAAVKNVAGTATLVTAGATASPTVDFDNNDQAAWTATIDVTGATARVRVTGAASNNVTWHCALIVQNVSS